MASPNRQNAFFSTDKRRSAGLSDICRVPVSAGPAGAGQAGQVGRGPGRVSPDTVSGRFRIDFECISDAFRAYFGMFVKISGTFRAYYGLISSKCRCTVRVVRDVRHVWGVIASSPGTYGTYGTIRGGHACMTLSRHNDDTSTNETITSTDKGGGVPPPPPPPDKPRSYHDKLPPCNMHDIITTQ